MTQTQKELLLKDLCVRLPYGVKVSVNQSELQNYDYKWKNWSFDEEPQEIDSVSIYGVTFGCMDMSDGVIGFEFIKPYLFPYSDISEKHEFLSTCNGYCNYYWTEETFDWLNKNHIDYRGLIEKKLAIDATNLNIY